MAIKFEKVSHIYPGLSKKTNHVAIVDIDLEIEGKGEFIAVCGQTGSGKSTLINHMNALLLPTDGTITIFDKQIRAKKNPKLKDVRRRVGLVFQFPEYQLFEETVLKDIMFGPLNFGVKKDLALEKAKEAFKLVGLPDALLNKSPFKLSGGQMRRVAIAGILAIDPDILILDEPTRGLDPKGSIEIMDLFNKIHKETGKTIVLISHDMDIVAKYAKRVIVMKDGKIAYDGLKEDLFDNKSFDLFHLSLPSTIKAVDYLNEKLGIGLSRKIFTMEDLLDALRKEERYE